MVIKVLFYFPMALQVLPIVRMAAMKRYENAYHFSAAPISIDALMVPVSTKRPNVMRIKIATTIQVIFSHDAWI